MAFSMRGREGGGGEGDLFVEMANSGEAARVYNMGCLVFNMKVLFIYAGKCIFLPLPS